MFEGSAHIPDDGVELRSLLHSLHTALHCHTHAPPMPHLLSRGQRSARARFEYGAAARNLQPGGRMRGKARRGRGQVHVGGRGRRRGGRPRDSVAAITGVVEGGGVVRQAGPDFLWGYYNCSGV
jgi:hypothetical protein